MKTLSLFFALFLFSTGVNAGEWSYDYLNKQFNKDQKKCFERAETIMNLFPKQKSPFFFAMKVKIENVYTAKTGKLRFTRMTDVLKYAKLFDAEASKELKTKVDWDTINPFLFDLASDVRDNLDAENLTSSVRQLDEKWEKFAGTELNPKKIKQSEELKVAETVLTTEEVSTTVATTPSANYTIATFNGMPKGTENVTSYNTGHEKELLIMINKERKKLKMDTLVMNADLSRACRYHAMDMGTQDYFEHDSHDLVSGMPKKVGGTFERIRTFYSASFVNTENIAAGNEDAAETYLQWYNSPGHYDNMFNPSSKLVGLGVVYVPGSEYTYYWVFCTAM